MSLLPESCTPMQTYSTSSTLDSIKNFFNGGRASKSMQRKRAHDNAKTLEGNLTNLQPLLLDGNSDPLWRYPVNNIDGVQNQPNIASHYSVVYQPHIANYEKTLGMAEDYSRIAPGHDSVNRIGQTNNMLCNAVPRTAVSSLLVDSSFSSNSSCSNHHNQNDISKSSKLPIIPHLPLGTLSTSSCSCSSSTSTTHGGRGQDAQTSNHNCHANGKMCRNNIDNGACSTTTTNSSSGGSSDGNLKTSPRILDKNTLPPCSQHSLYASSNIEDTTNTSQRIQYSPYNELYTQYPINVQVENCMPLNQFHHENIKTFQKSDDITEQGLGGILNSLWKTKSRKNNKGRKKVDKNCLRSEDIITCNQCQKIGTSTNSHSCSCSHVNYTQHRLTGSREIPFVQNMAPLRVPPLPNIQSMASYGHANIEDAWQTHNKNTLNLKEGDDRRYWLHDRNPIGPSTPKSKTEMQRQRFGTLGNNYKQKDSLYNRNALEDGDTKSSFISMKQRGLTLGPSKKSQNTNRGVMPNPDDILPKEAWTDFSGDNHWPKPLNKPSTTNDTGEKICNSDFRSRTVKGSFSPERNEFSKSPVYVNIELENCDLQQQLNHENFVNGKDDDLLDNTSDPLTKPKPLPRRQSSIRSISSPDQNKRHHKRINQVESEKDEIFNTSSIDTPIDDENDSRSLPLDNNAQLKNTKINNSNRYYDQSSSPSPTSDIDSKFTASLNSPLKDPDLMLHRKRGLPPLPKQRGKLSSELKEIKSFSGKGKERGTHKDVTNKS